MLKRREKQFKTILVLVDSFLILFSFYLSFYFRFKFIPAPLGVPPIEPYIYLSFFVLFATLISLKINGLYTSKGFIWKGSSLIKIFLSSLFSFIITSAFLQFLRGFSFSRIFLFIFYLSLFLFLSIWRFFFKKILKIFHKKGKFIERAIILGAGNLGKLLVDKLKEHRELGLQIIGFLDDDPGKANFSYEGINVLGSLNDLEEVLNKNNIDGAFISFPYNQKSKGEKIINSLQKRYLDIYFVPDIVQMLTLRTTVEEYYDLPLIYLNPSPLEGWGNIVKRVMDIFFSSFGIIFLFPFWLIISFLIKREDGGPIFYKQKRMGLDGKEFEILKFRTMEVEAEKDKPVMSKKNDKRVTKIGGFLRKWSLDETPQFINVLLGDMSLVGPRPERPEFVDEFVEKFPDYFLRHKVKCGITGWAQVNGFRGPTSIKRRLQYDIYYIQNWSIWLDLKIIALTILGGFKNKNV